MLVGGSSIARRCFLYLLGAVIFACFVSALWYAGVAVGLVSRQAGPALLGYTSGSSTLGYYCGVGGFAIIVFEMLLWPRKKLRGYRLPPRLNLSSRRTWICLLSLPLTMFTTRTWMWLHIWLGLACLPLAILHSGFAYGGLLTGVVMILFLLVIASGAWGLVMQQLIPQRLLEDIPGETIATERFHVVHQMLDEASAIVDRLRGVSDVDEGDGAVAVQTRPATQRLGQIVSFFDQQIKPYLDAEKPEGFGLNSRSTSQQRFAELRRDARGDIANALNRLEAICETRRQLDRQYNLYWWLHSWLCVHLPLSIALFVLLSLHVVYALKFW